MSIDKFGHHLNAYTQKRETYLDISSNNSTQDPILQLPQTQHFVEEKYLEEKLTKILKTHDLVRKTYIDDIVKQLKSDFIPKVSVSDKHILLLKFTCLVDRGRPFPSDRFYYTLDNFLYYYTVPPYLNDSKIIHISADSSSFMVEVDDKHYTISTITKPSNIVLRSGQRIFIHNKPVFETGIVELLIEYKS